MPFGVEAYSKATGPVQTNNLSINNLGVYSDESGVTQYNFVTQLQLGTLAPEFGLNKVVDSVVLEIPYVSEVASTKSTGWSSYNLKDIYVTTSGNEKTTHNYEPVDITPSSSALPTMGLEVYRNGVQLLTTDANNDFITQKKYYSNEDTQFEAQKIGVKLNDFADASQNTSFKPSFRQIVKRKVITDTIPTTNTHAISATEVETREAPMMRLRLNDTFGNDILTASSSDLLNNNAFTKFYKGLYFRVIPGVGDSGTLSKLDFKKGKVVIYYKEDKFISYKVGNNTITKNRRPMKTLVLNMSGVSRWVNKKLSYPSIYC